MNVCPAAAGAVPDVPAERGGAVQVRDAAAAAGDAGHRGGGRGGPRAAAAPERLLILHIGLTCLQVFIKEAGVSLETPHESAVVQCGL